jgi:hypothetical protein
MVATLQGPFGPITLNMPTLTIGYAPDNQLVVNDANVSSYHAVIRMETQHASITDLGSMSGTYVNEQRLVPNTPRFLNTYDNIRLGNTTFRYEENMSPLPNRESNSGIPLDAQGRPFGYTAYGQQQGNQPPGSYAPPPPPPYNPNTPNPYGSAWAPTEVASGNQPNPYDQNVIPTEIASGNLPNRPSGQFPREVPPQQSYSPPPQGKTNNQLKIILIAVAAVVVLGAVGGGIFLYVVTRPQPVISVNSQYAVNMMPAGSTSTEFRVSGHKFSSNSTITFLLDGSVAPGNPATESESNGDVTTTLTVTKDWSVGGHTLTARDGSGYATKDGVEIKIVSQGQAHTPGLNGAPADDSSFSINANYLGNGEPSFQIQLDVSGHPDPKGGSVCTSADDGSQYKSQGQDNMGPYIDEYTFSCSGTYKGGNLSYTETLATDKYTYANGVVCTENGPTVWVHLEGAFSSATSISGSYSRNSNSYSCTQGASTGGYSAVQGTWTGQMKQ